MVGFGDRALDIVRDHQDGHVPLLMQHADGLIQSPGGDRVEPGHRLVQQQDLACGAESPGQKHPLLLAPGELAITTVPERSDAKQVHPLLRPPSLFLRVPDPPSQVVQATGQHHLFHAGGKVPLHHRLLGKVADLIFPKPLIETDCPPGGSFQMQKPPDERALAGTVLAYDGKVPAGIHVERHVIHHSQSLIGEGKVVTGNQAHQLSASRNATTFPSIRLT